MAIEDRGFASMDRNRQREIASKGGLARHRRKQSASNQSPVPETSPQAPVSSDAPLS